MPQSERQARLLKLYNKKLSLLGHSILTSLESLSKTHYIVKKNYDDLIYLLLKCEEELLFEIYENRKLGQNLKLEISRMLHNYLSSVQSLIDHTRRLRNKLKNNELNTFWDVQIKKLLNNACIKFVKQFRNYIQHYEIPILHSKLKISNPDGITPEVIQNRNATFEYNIFIDREELLIWDRWNNKSKRYINKFGDDLDLKSIFLEYQQLNNDFYDWFYNKIYSLYEDDIKKVYEIDDKIRQIMNAKKRI